MVTIKDLDALADLALMNADMCEGEPELAVDGYQFRQVSDVHPPAGGGGCGGGGCGELRRRSQGPGDQERGGVRLLRACWRVQRLRQRPAAVRVPEALLLPRLDLPHHASNDRRGAGH